MHPCVIVLATAIALGPLTVQTSVAQEGKPLFPKVVDSTHATESAEKFFDTFFTAKSRHDVDATMDHFSRGKLTYIDATLGWPFCSYEALREVFAQYMPNWPPSGLSYPTRILGNEHSAVVAFTDTPELFGGEIRVLAAIDLEGGKVVRWIDYWDSRNFGAEQAAKMRTPAAKFPTDFKETSVQNNTSAKIRNVVNKLNAAMASNNAKGAATLLSNDVVYEDMTLRTQVLGKLAVERYLGRALQRLPAGEGASVLHIVGSDMGGGYEWEAGPAYRTTVRRGITALALDGDGLISRLTTVWDGGLIPDADIKALVLLSLD